jgi:biopolymer transport protein ExbD
MAELSQNTSKQSGGKVRVKRLSTRIDMTPMVDLAFLLLTFFILSSSFNLAKVMDMQMPDKGEGAHINAKDVLNVVLSSENKIYWWMGIDPPVQQTDFSSVGLRKLLTDKKLENRKLMVLIKPKDDSRYQNMVDLLDEIEISGIERYAIVDLSEDDKTIVRSFKVK